MVARTIGQKPLSTTAAIDAKRDVAAASQRVCARGRVGHANPLFEVRLRRSCSGAKVCSVRAAPASVRTAGDGCRSTMIFKFDRFLKYTALTLHTTILPYVTRVVVQSHTDRSRSRDRSRYSAFFACSAQHHTCTSYLHAHVHAIYSRCVFYVIKADTRIAPSPPPPCH